MQQFQLRLVYVLLRLAYVETLVAMEELETVEGLPNPMEALVAMEELETSWCDPTQEEWQEVLCLGHR